ncbi:cellulose binding domain-containing protein [Verrucosispora sp. WMMA2044]|uniref:cellulose binding domain-containing protein n=1 Tax=Verrucosispora sp. WMMA2044 TaxID=3016419 RepID=UPI00248BBA3C|nr:cellulose binding domain-containing protein [Verrucosispora sp. WMMA2044]WBB47202.1 cellulose binding domain-containing protein [Verrucosispora sp. WMMA2044]
MSAIVASAVTLTVAGALAIPSVSAAVPTPHGASVAAAVACDDRLYGWAAVSANGVSTTTGGGNAPTQNITSLADLRQYAGGSTPRVLRISGTISTGSSPVEVGSNKTLVGADANATIRGGININGGGNIIVRNLNVQGGGQGSSPADTIAARNAHHLWFDHLNLWDASDGLLDLTRGVDYITVSWSKFWYTNSSHSHRLASLVGGGSTHGDTDSGKLNATYHHNWFAELVDQRGPRMLFGKGHIYNSYYTSAGNAYSIGTGSYASVLVENNYFKNVNNPHRFQDSNPTYITARGNVYDGTSGRRDTGAQGSGVTPFTNPPYSYALDNANDVPGIVSNCAGPKLSNPTTPPTTTPPTTTPPTTTPPTTTPPTTTPPTTNPPSGACSATYRTVSSWSGGFQGEVVVRAGNAPINGWTVRWNLSSGQGISQLWNGNLSTSGSSVIVRNVDYNGSLPAAGTTTFGFLGSGSPSTPSLTCTSP